MNKITKQKVGRLQKHELTAYIAKLLWPNANLIERYTHRCESVMVANGSVKEFSGRIDYCNNWNDLMPLVVKYIGDIDWEGKGDDPIVDMLSCDDPQRALAECLFLVLQEKINEILPKR